MYKCNDCETLFKSSSSLNKHRNNAKYCIDYKTIYFLCKNCGLFFKGLNNIDMHRKNCNGTLQIDNPILQTEPQNTQNTDTTSKATEKLLLIEKIKNQYCTRIIQQKLGIDLSNIFTEDTPLHDIISQLTSINSQNNQKIALPDIPNIEVSISDKIDSVCDDEVLFVIEKEETDDDILAKCLLTINKQIELLKTSRNFNQCFTAIRLERRILMAKMPVNDYIKLLQTQNDSMIEIFIEKKYPIKKINSMIRKSLSVIDMRLLFFQDYHLEILDPDDIEKFDSALNYGIQSKTDFKVFDIQALLNNMTNYGTVIFPIKHTLSRYLLNNRERCNVAFIKPQKCVSDDFSFYTLEKISDENKRHWRMDCRLENLSVSIVDILLPYLISMFRRFFYDVFNDNKYRNNYRSQCQLTQADCEQTVRNIFVLADHMTFSKTLRDLVKENSTLKETEDDIVNLRGDDTMQKKRFDEYVSEDPYNINIIKRLFDEMTTEEAMHFYKNR